MHDGIDYVGAGDYGGPADRTVFAIADGVVVHDFDGYDPAKRWNPSAPDSAGNMVIIGHNLHGTKYFVRYVHLAKNTVSNGERVKCGQVIGEYGDVGYSFGQHLHLDMWTASWQRIDPTPVLLRGLRASGIIA